MFASTYSQTKNPMATNNMLEWQAMFSLQYQCPTKNIKKIPLNNNTIERSLSHSPRHDERRPLDGRGHIVQPGGQTGVGETVARVGRLVLAAVERALFGNEAVGEEVVDVDL